MGEASKMGLDEELDSPYVPPTADRGDPWSIGPPEALALRQAHRREEAYAKALAIANVVYFVLFTPWTCYLVCILIAHMIGSVSAPLGGSAGLDCPDPHLNLYVDRRFRSGLGFFPAKALGSWV